MEKKYINHSRYKKGNARKRRSLDTVRTNLNKTSIAKKSAKPKTKTVSNAVKTNIYKKKSKLQNIVICVILLILIAVISRALLKDENEPFIPIIFGVNDNDETISLGIITSDNMQDINTNNIILAELNKYSKDMLLQINEDYSIKYCAIGNVEKNSNKEYILTKSNKSNVSIRQVKEALESYMADETSMYYNKLSNIKEIILLNEQKIQINLKSNDPYFIYNLDINLTTVKDKTNYLRDSSSNSKQLILNRHKKADKTLPKTIIVKKYEDMYDAVEAYKNEEIDMFITNAENVENILGKYEYNIKTYRNGEALFLFGNAKSQIYSNDEVRKAIAYSINRDYIISEVLKSKGNKIDLPYIYDNVKYKYDVYAAENLLLTNGYSKKNKIYTKTKNGKTIKLELSLLVNKEDEEKVQVASIIKNNLSSIGISINVEKISQSTLENRIKNGNYDLVLATVNLNNNPNITFLNNNLYITEDIQEIYKQIEESTTHNLYANIVNLKKALSEEIGAIGIYSKVSYFIYNKDIIGVDEISYMNIFKNLFN